MEIYGYDFTFSEVPDHISLTISVKGCGLKCDGCSWKGLTHFEEFTLPDLENILIKNNKKISAVCFLGGEWESNIDKYFDLVKKYEKILCLYTGKELEELDETFVNKLDFIKVGNWLEEKGGLNNKDTNQKYIDIKNNKVLNYKFQGEMHGSTY